MKTAWITLELATFRELSKFCYRFVYQVFLSFNFQFQIQILIYFVLELFSLCSIFMLSYKHVRLSISQLPKICKRIEY